MSEVTTTNPSRNCKTCGKPVIDMGTGGIVHDGGGVTQQKCQNCKWTGGQAGRYSQCPRCGDMTSLIDEHSAS